MSYKKITVQQLRQIISEEKAKIKKVNESNQYFGPDGDDIIQIIKDRVRNNDSSEIDEAMEVMEFIGLHYGIDFEFGAGLSRQQEGAVNEMSPEVADVVAFLATGAGIKGASHIAGKLLTALESGKFGEKGKEIAQDIHNLAKSDVEEGSYGKKKKYMEEDHSGDPNAKYVVRPCKNKKEPWAVWEGEVRVKGFASKAQAQAYADKQNKEQGLDEVEKEYGQQYPVDKFKKLKGKKVTYQGTSYDVVDADSAAITLKGENDQEKVVNLNMFKKSGLIPEVEAKEIPTPSEEPVSEGKATCCGRCGRVHIRKSEGGQGCKKPYLSENSPKHCNNK